MNYNLSDTEILFVIFLSTKFGITLFLSTIAFTISTKLNKIANKWLTAFFLGFSLIFLIDVLEEHNYNFVPTLLLYFNEFITFLIPISLYLAIQAFVRPIKKLTKNDIILFIPWILDIIFKSFFIFNKIEFSLQNQEYPAWYGILYNILFIIFWIFILTKSLLIIWKHQKSVKDLSADVFRIDLKWLLYVLIFPAVLIFTQIIFSFSDSDLFIDIADMLEFLVVFYMGYHLVLQKEIFPYQETQLESIHKVIKSPQQSDTENFGLSPSKIEKTKNDILQLMLEKQPYLENDITLLELAQRLQMKSHFLSYFLNTHFNKNFYSFINEYRIEESKKILVDPNKKHFNMIGVAFESGFNSKTTFNTTFKKLTGISPSTYRNQQAID